jgi:hypothetical protein
MLFPVNIRRLVGIFFLVLAIIFGIAAGVNYSAAQRQWTPRAKTRRRVAIVFALVGLGLLIF